MDEASRSAEQAPEDVSASPVSKKDKKKKKSKKSKEKEEVAESVPSAQNDGKSKETVQEKQAIDSTLPTAEVAKRQDITARRPKQS
jgi:hypothetical protein